LNVVMFGFNDWSQWESRGFRTRCGSLALALARHPSLNRMLVVSTPHSLGMNAIRAVRGMISHTGDPRTTLRPFVVREVSSRVLTLEQTRLLPSRVPWDAMRRADAAMTDGPLRAAILRSCAALGMRDWVLWVADPIMTRHIGHTGESVSVFDAIDDWSAHPQKRAMRAWVEDGYASAHDRADVIFTVSKALQDRLGDGRADVHWLPNGVDARRFEGHFDVPAELRDLRTPLLGYVGVIQERLDIKAVTALARALPHATIVFVGPVITPRHIEPLLALENVRFLGERSAAEVPAYIHAFDVCLMPHVDDALTRSMDPLKVYEYLAAGKQVVATGIPHTDWPEGLVRRCHTPEEFASAVRLLVEDSGTSDVGDREKRIKFARSRSWDSRLDAMLAIISDVAASNGAVLS